MKFTFLRVRKPRQFEYKPRYYDPEEEAREERKKAVLGANYKDNYKTAGEKSGSTEEYKPGQYLRGMTMRKGVMVDRRSSQNKRARSIRFVIALILLAAAFVRLMK
ncbi:MAG: hypothetical protein LUF90_07765 [Rikenellaceae bacterium]|nr:hypothetical protein [Rikenellaceae bacterium]